MTKIAADIMTRNVISVRPTALVPEIAALLSNHAISAVPVIDAQGHLQGMISEGDLMKPFSAEAQTKRAWWLEVLAEGSSLAPEFLNYISQDKRPAAELMSRDVITVPMTATAPEVADLLIKHRIKRVPVMDGPKMVGIISRADIVRAIASAGSIEGR
jgi:CBS domain-containing protein